MNQNKIRCPLCGTEDNEFFFRDKFRDYRRCGECSLLFVPPEFHVTRESEKARYEEHNNDPDDAGYRGFLERIVTPVKKDFAPGARGLDFGCGPTPLLAELLTAEGYEMETYDPFYDSGRGVLDETYDFIVSTEVVEHLSRPLGVFEKLLAMLKPGGALAVMTRLYDDSVDFSGWHYKNDRTHICFFSVGTFDWLARRLDLKYERTGNDIFVFWRDTDNHPPAWRPDPSSSRRGAGKK